MSFYHSLGNTALLVRGSPLPLGFPVMNSFLMNSLYNFNGPMVEYSPAMCAAQVGFPEK